MASAPTCAARSSTTCSSGWPGIKTLLQWCSLPRAHAKVAEDLWSRWWKNECIVVLVGWLRENRRTQRPMVGSSPSDRFDSSNDDSIGHEPSVSPSRARRWHDGRRNGALSRSLCGGVRCVGELLRGKKRRRQKERRRKGGMMMRSTPHAPLESLDDSPLILSNQRIAVLELGNISPLTPSLSTIMHPINQSIQGAAWVAGGCWTRYITAGERSGEGATDTHAHTPPATLRRGLVAAGKSSKRPV